jgi:predicted DNA-binding ribbon-helix-helix protein
MFKPIEKKILTGAIAAAFLIGGAGLLHNTQANAATTTTGAAVVKNTNSSTKDHGKRGLEKNLIKETATILGVDPTTITDQLKQGKTLVQIAEAKGITEEVLLQKLTDAKNQSIAAKVISGKLTQAQADKMKAGLSGRLKKEVEHVEKSGGHEKGKFGSFGDPEALAQILGVTRQQLKADLQAGKSLVEIAQAKGIAEDQLINKIKDGMTSKLKQFVEKKDTPEAGDTPDAAAAQ